MVTLKNISVINKIKNTKNSTIILGMFESSSLTSEIKDFDSTFSGAISSAIKIGEWA